MVLVYNLRRADRKGGRACQPYDGPYVVDGITKNDNYRLKNTSGKTLRTNHHGCNLKRFHERSMKDNSVLNYLASEVEADIKCLGKTAPSNQRFAPTTPKWRAGKCEELHLSVSTENNERRTGKLLAEPLAVQQIVGDGNCLFRAISYVVTLSEEHHQFFRAAACNVLKDKRYRAFFESRHISNNLTASNYIKQCKMDKVGTWGTDVEIFSLATFLNTRIAVHYRPPSSETCSWYYYDPQMYPCYTTDMSIYLKNSGNHFERVNSVKTLH